jgi:hypothetical protein
VTLAPSGITYPNKIEGFIALRQEIKHIKHNVGASIIFENLNSVRKVSFDSMNKFRPETGRNSPLASISGSQRLLKGFGTAQFVNGLS